MQPRDKIAKSSWNLHETVKDAVTTNLTNAIRSGQLKIEAASVEKLLAVINASADQGYQSGTKSFMKTIDSSLAESVNDAEFPSLSKTSTKKK